LKYIVTTICLLLAGVAQAVEVNATLDWANRRVAAFAVHGVVEKVNVAAGEQVKKGQPLAQLDQTPFIYKSKKNQANIDGIKPRLFDAKQNLDQAQELYDRTVLSQVDLQRADVQFQGVEAEQLAAKAELEIARWQQRQSVLNAPCDCLIINNTLLPGMVINDDNQIAAKIELAEVGMMNADVILEQNTTLRMQQSVQVVVAGKTFPAVVTALAMQNGKWMARVQFRFDGSVQLFAGQSAKVKF
jgi:membrane fusion protein, multidrug efflux system